MPRDDQALPVSAEDVAAAVAAIAGAVVATEFAIETRDPQQMETIRQKLVEAGLTADLVPDDE